MSKRRKTGERHGVVLVDKPKGWSSTKLTAEVSRGLGGVRAGHAGTLDPMATGLMLVCVGEGTKLATFLSGADKVYEGEITFGKTTDTLDAEGKLTGERPAGHLTQIEVATALASMRGQTQQTPPMYSALKLDGQPLYELARQGVEVPRVARDITVYEAELLGFEPGESPRARIRYRVSKGTYVRTLAADLGELVGTGAHLSALRRTSIDSFDVAEAAPGETVQARLAAGEVLVIPLAAALRNLDKLEASAITAKRVRDGQRVPLTDLIPLSAYPDGHRLAVVEGDRLIAVAEVEAGGVVHAVRGFSV